CRNRRPCCTSYTVEEPNEYCQSYGRSSAEPKGSRGDRKGKREEAGGCEEGLLRWSCIKLCHMAEVYRGRKRESLQTISLASSIHRNYMNRKPYAAACRSTEANSARQLYNRARSLLLFPFSDLDNSR